MGAESSAAESAAVPPPACLPLAPPHVQQAARGAPAPSDTPSVDEAEQFLARARKSGDRAAQATALADLGLLALDQGNIPRAVAYLDEALALARALGDQAREGDVLGIFGLAAVAARQFDRARECQEQALALSLRRGRSPCGKTHAGAAQRRCALTGNLPQALDLLAGALALARTLGDRSHEADLLWHMAVRYAESRRREEALVSGQAAVDLLERLGNPQAGVYREHLQRFRQSDEEMPRGESGNGVSATVMTTIMTGGASAGSASPRGRKAVNHLRMAVSAARALTRFVASGLKTVNAQTLQLRRERCDGCVQHTGLRCRVCGCYTNLKLRLPHEECPLKLWPAIDLTEVPPSS